MEIKPDHELVLQNHMLPYLPIKDIVALKLVDKRINNLVTDFVNAMKDKLPIVDFGPVTDPLHVTHLIIKHCEQNRIKKSKILNLLKNVTTSHLAVLYLNSIRHEIKHDDINMSWISLIEKMRRTVYQLTMRKEKQQEKREYPMNMELFALAKEIGQLEALKELRISCNKLTRIPSSIGNLKNLKCLHIKWQDLSVLPEEIGNLSNLIELSVFDSNLTKLPKSICNLKKLTKLWLTSNKVLIFPKEFGNLPALTSLNIARNAFCDLPEEIYKLKAINYLIFGPDVEFDEKRLKNIPSMKKIFTKRGAESWRWVRDS